MPTGGSALKDVQLQVIDFVVIVGYFVAIIGVGIWVRTEFDVYLMRSVKIITLNELSRKIA